MDRLFNTSITEIARMSGEAVPHSTLRITRASTLYNIHPHSIVFAQSLTPERSQALTKAVNCLLLVPHQIDSELLEHMSVDNIVAPVRNPRLSFARIMNTLVGTLPQHQEYECVSGAWVSTGAEIADDVVIEPGAFIDHSVTIEEKCTICSGAVVRAYTTIGKESIVREGAAIGVFGFAYERDECGVPIPIPHLGGVRIGSNVDIGCYTTVCAGTIDPTVIGNDAKIDSLVHVAHNCVVGDNTMIIACAEVSGSVRIGKGAWIGPNSSVIEGRTIGDEATVGLGAVVLADVDDRATVAGNPAIATAEISRRNRAINCLIEGYYGRRS
jgi:UDP-3-O-[3-hydroxymyristoyl] glucosamine N-acyltransferase LpxD